MTISKREYALKRKYGITEKQWDAMFDRQHGKCPICKRPLYKPGNTQGKRAAPVDHDHKTGRVRGLTCLRCNRFKIARNTVDSVRNLLMYLESEFDGRYI
jgi:hypothetical protein